MGLLDGMLGGIVGAGLTQLVIKAVEDHGGVQAIVSQFEAKGLGGVAQSWVGGGDSQPVTAEQIQSVLGGGMVENLAAKFGIPADQLCAKIAELLPEAIAKMTQDKAASAA